MTSQRHDHRNATARARPSSLREGSTGTGRGHGKAILLGEHSIVYEGPAIALPLLEMNATASIRAAPEARIASDLYEGAVDGAPARFAPIVEAVRAARAVLAPGAGPFELTLHSDIPYERGLGSSAATAAAIVTAVADAVGAAPDEDTRHELIQRAERVAHGAPSGLDARAVVAPTPIRFDRGRAEPAGVASPLTFVVADTGVRGSTREAVASVRARREADRAGIDAVIRRLATLADEAAADLVDGRADALGDRMNEAHALLVRIDVSSHELDALVVAATAAGALGAKLTGGGRGGCVLALAPSREDAPPLASALVAAGAARVWTTTVGASSNQEAE
ncbi:mevalonate kinase [Pseudoclavibacter endophyticus]|uniref:Mevalonate kinase n=1 Tax=Pseudoclavibacter endophyticus TaxID=1778590 RepID=A0A6H9WPJ6_9MICO|nr:mevalonate kinase [Pseudoclavibacter endophyticus]KAB1650048.1 mevalonate kinase [Pseudoclavibacter endophyticus]GGA57679.1 mevalonate kinase [Pseudoclavibacter endophyticus]